MRRPTTRTMRRRAEGPTTSVSAHHQPPGSYPPPRREGSTGFPADQPTEQFHAVPPLPVPPRGRGHEPLLPPSLNGRTVKRARRSRWKPIIGVAVALLVALFVVAGVAGGKSSPATPALNKPSATTNSLAAPEVTSADNTKAAIYAWWSTGGNDRITALGNDSGAASKAAAAVDFTGLRTACAALQSDTEAAQGGPPIPDQQAQEAWAKGLAQYARAATDCLAGIDTSTPSLISQSADELGAGVDAFNAVTQRVLTLTPG